MQLLIPMPTPVLAWASADEDDDLHRMLDCLCAALEPFELPGRVAPVLLSLLAQVEHGLRDVTVELVDAPTGTQAQRGLIDVDDVHRLNDPRIDGSLQALLERLPMAGAPVQGQ